MSREMKHSGTDWIGEIPVQWELAPTKRVFRGKKRIVGDEADNYERLALTLNGVVKRNKDDNEGLQPEQFNGYQILEKNELVFKLIDLQNIRTSRVGLSPYTGIVSPAYIILSNSETDNRFYYYWFMDMYNRCIFNQMGDDGVRSALNIKDVLEIPLPLIAESTRIKIASFLDKKCAEIDEMIALQEKIVEELKAYKQSVITEAVTKGLNPDVPMKDSGVQCIGKIPTHWDVKSLRFVFHNLDYLREPISAEQRQRKNPIYDYYGASGVIDTIDYYNVDDTVLLIGEDGANLRMRNLPLIYKASGKFWVNNHAHILKPISDDYDYMAMLLEALDYSDFITGSAQPKLSQDNLKKVRLCIPPLNEQKDIASFLNEKCTEIDNLISIKLSKIDSLKEYKKSIIYEYVTGKKEVIE